MSEAVHPHEVAKRLARVAYRKGLGLRARLSALTSGGGGEPRLYYGGAPAGPHGGPRLKIAKLRQAFPEHAWNYNLVYVVSAGPYPPLDTLRRIKARRIPLVLNQNGVYYPAWYGGDWEAENRRMAGPYHLADHVFYQSEFCRRSAERFLGARAGAGEILHNAVDTGHFMPAGRERDAQGPFVFLVAGRVPSHQAYRLEGAIRGLAQARKEGLDARLLMAGVIDDAASTPARAIAESVGVAAFVTYAGPYRQEEAPAVFNAADAFLITTHNDACPTAVLEAMACGLPVVYTRSGGVPELVGGTAGAGVATGESFERSLMPDPRALAQAMMAVAERRETFAEAARRRAVERFDIRDWYERQRHVFRLLLDGRHG